ncbi:spherulin-1A [Colletotrichum graminicola]|nr:spherulin-1A [Colletotrichum graminicola]
MIAFPITTRGLSLLLLCLQAVGTNAIDNTLHPELVRLLRKSPTELDKLKTLPNDKDWTFNYFAHQYHTYTPGGVLNANAATFPATVDNGMAMALITLGPSAMLPPYYHARDFNYVVSVVESAETYMTLEGGARVIRTKLDPGMMTVFPQGRLHMIQTQARHLLGRKHRKRLMRSPRLWERHSDIGPELRRHRHTKRCQWTVRLPLMCCSHSVRRQPPFLPSLCNFAVISPQLELVPRLALLNAFSVAKSAVTST